MSDDPLKQLGEYLTATEAESLALLIGAGEHTTHALASVGVSRRDRVAELLKRVALGIIHLSYQCQCCNVSTPSCSDRTMPATHTEDLRGSCP